jgi:membrane-bound lytic murein transglycosylase B
VFAVLGICVAASTSFAAFGHLAASTMQPPRKSAPVVHAAVRVKPDATAVTPPAKALTPFEVEQRMSAAALIARWDPDVARASKRFRVPEAWIRSVMEAESGGRTMASETQPITSNKGAMGLMQLMPGTWREWRATLALGTDPYDPHDNITAATAYLHVLHTKYGYPAMFAAYNDGPGNLEQRMIDGGLLPQETQLYVARITGVVPMRAGARSLARFTRPNGEAVMINGFAVTRVRAPLPGEYPPNVNAVIAMGRLSQGVCETLGETTRVLRAHGGRV